MSKTLFKSVGENFNNTMMDAMTSVVINKDLETLNDLVEFINEVIDDKHYDARGKSRAILSIYHCLNTQVNKSAVGYFKSEKLDGFFINEDSEMPTLASMIGRIKIDNDDALKLFFNKMLTSFDRDKNLSSLNIHLMTGMLHSVNDHNFWLDLCDCYKKEIAQCNPTEYSSHYSYDTYKKANSSLLGHALNFGNPCAANAIFEKIDSFESPFSVEDTTTPVQILQQTLNRGNIYASRYTENDGGALFKLVDEYLNNQYSNNYSMSFLLKNHISEMTLDNRFKLFLKMCQINKNEDLLHIEKSKIKFAIERMWADLCDFFVEDIKDWSSDQLKTSLNTSINSCSPHAFQLIYQKACELNVITKEFKFENAFYFMETLKNDSSEEYVHLFFKEMLEKMNNLGIEIEQFSFPKGGNVLHHAARSLKDKPHEALQLLSSMLELNLDPSQKDDRGWAVSSHLHANIRQEWQTIIKSRQASRVAKNAIEDIFKEINLKP